MVTGLENVIVDPRELMYFVACMQYDFGTSCLVCPNKHLKHNYYVNHVDVFNYNHNDGIYMKLCSICPDAASVLPGF